MPWLFLFVIIQFLINTLNSNLTNLFVTEFKSIQVTDVAAAATAEIDDVTYTKSGYTPIFVTYVPNSYGIHFSTLQYTPTFADGSLTLSGMYIKNLSDITRSAWLRIYILWKLNT